VLFESYFGNWEHYLDAIYALFKADFVDSKPLFRGVRLGLKRYPLTYNKEATFWHFILIRKIEAERMPDLRRCERISWPRAIIENSQDFRIKFWKNERKGEKRICLWLEPENYLVILAERKGYILPWTAYLVVQEHQKKKLQIEYEAYLSKG
jgi:hypothetical protein